MKGSLQALHREVALCLWDSSEGRASALNGWVRKHFWQNYECGIQFCLVHVFYGSNIAFHLLWTLCFGKISGTLHTAEIWKTPVSTPKEPSTSDFYFPFLNLCWYLKAIQIKRKSKADKSHPVSWFSKLYFINGIGIIQSPDTTCRRFSIDNF